MTLFSNVFKKFFIGTRITQLNERYFPGKNVSELPHSCKASLCTKHFQDAGNLKVLNAMKKRMFSILHN